MVVASSVILSVCADENNWRNEYPDEEGPTPSSSSDLDNYGDYRHTRALYSILLSDFRDCLLII